MGPLRCREGEEEQASGVEEGCWGDRVWRSPVCVWLHSGLSQALTGSWIIPATGKVFDWWTAMSFICTSSAPPPLAVTLIRKAVWWCVHQTEVLPPLAVSSERCPDAHTASSKWRRPPNVKSASKPPQISNSHASTHAHTHTGTQSRRRSNSCCYS